MISSFYRSVENYYNYKYKLKKIKKQSNKKYKELNNYQYKSINKLEES